MILIQTSAGIRVGALVKCTIDSLYPLIVNKEKNEIKVGSIKLNGYDTGVALVKVYWTSRKWRYFSFITKECREAINKYLALRSNFGEKLKVDSPLIRDHFFSLSPYMNLPAYIGEQSVNNLVRKLCVAAKLDIEKISPNHSLRKVFESALINVGIPDPHRHILEGYVQGIELKHYYDMALSESHNEILTSYLSVVDRLTIEEKYKLKKEVAVLKEQVKEQPDYNMVKVLYDNARLELDSIKLQMKQQKEKDREDLIQILNSNKAIFDQFREFGLAAAANGMFKKGATKQMVEKLMRTKYEDIFPELKS